MRLLLVCLVVAVAVNSITAQSLSPHQSDADLHDVHFINSQEGWTVGDRGVILHTGDGGQSWLPQTAPVAVSLYGVYFIDSKHGWVVGGSTLPYMRRGRGVVLRTDDGGKTWLREPVDTLPSLRRVWFQSEKSGFAVGDGSPLFPSGVFFTGDGGRSWNPVAVRGLAGWAAATFRADRHQKVAGIGLLLSAQGQIVHCVGGNCTTAETPLPKHRMRDIEWLSDRQAFAVGDSGTVWMSIDGGTNWQDISRLLAVATAESHDLLTVACQGNSICIGTSTGAFIQSVDGGRSWSQQDAGETKIPANRIHFVDSQQAFAVGGLGTIRTTTDGGATWAVQRGADRRMFALGVFSKPERVPWMLWADLAGGRNARVRTMVVDRTPDAALTTSLATRLQEATLAVGGHSADVWPELTASRLAQAIATWQPDVIVTDPANVDVVKELVESLAEDRKIRVWAAVSSGSDSRETVFAKELAVPMGQTTGSLATSAVSLLADRFAPPAKSVAFQSVVGGAKLSTGIASGSGNARESAGPSSHTPATMQRMAQKQTVLRSLLDKAASQSGAESSAWLAQIENMSAELSQDQAANTLFELAHLHVRRGDPTSALSALESLTRKYPQAPIATAAIRYAVLWVSSAELEQHATQSHRPHESVNQVASNARQGTPVIPASAVMDDQGLDFGEPRKRQRPKLLRESTRPPQTMTPHLPLDDLIKVPGLNEKPIQAVATSVLPDQPNIDVWDIATWSQRIDPMLKSEPQLQFAMEARRRRDNQPGLRHRAVYQRLARSAATIAYRKCASQELQFLVPQRQPAKSLWIAPPAARPHLDGVLGDATWNQTSAEEIKSRFPDSPPTEVWIARGPEHLYIAARCQRLFAVDVTESPPRTTRDQDLSHHDRLELWLDVDRDYSTAWHLTIDEFGHATDRLVGDLTWNPKWFIAQSADAESWTIEAAIPLQELVPDSVLPDAPWAFAVERIIPGAIEMQWPIDFDRGQLQTAGVLK